MELDRSLIELFFLSAMCRRKEARFRVWESSTACRDWRSLPQSSARQTVLTASSAPKCVGAVVDRRGARRAVGRSTFRRGGAGYVPATAKGVLMSTIARRSCGRCGPFEVNATAVLVGPRWRAGPMRLACRFRCPTCRVLLIEAIDGLTVCALLSSGARWDDWEWPKELAERPGDDMPPISGQDVVSFGNALRQLPTAAR